MANGESALEPVQTLPLLKSPLVENRNVSPDTVPKRQPSGPDFGEFGYRDASDTGLEFQRYNEATAVEVFYDLFFAANLCVFAEVQDITNVNQLANFIVYFSLLWFNWALLGLFDVRFVTDSIFERLARAFHFGVMVGMAVVAPNFTLTDQHAQTFRTMGIILMTSRLTMTAQYLTIMWNTRRYKTTRLPIALAAGVHFVAALVYLGTAFAFQGGSGALWVTWMVVTALEMVLQVAFSLKWTSLSFYGTHLCPRISLLSFILMGEGIITVCLSVGRIVVNANQWTSPTIGNVAAGIAIIYVLFMIYIDWRRELRGTKVRQLLWTVAHFPFHLAFKLFLTGASQFVIWWKIFELIGGVRESFAKTLEVGDDPAFNVTAQWFVDSLNKTVTDIFSVFPPIYSNTGYVTDQSLLDILAIPDEFWERLNNNGVSEDDPTLLGILDSFVDLIRAIENSLFTTFKIDGFAGVVNKFEGEDWELEEKVNNINWERFNVVFTYSYISAGLTLIFLNVLFIVASKTRWTFFSYVRKAINFLAGIGLCLVTIVNLNEESYSNFAGTPWPLPTLLLVMFTVLIIHHLPQPPPLFFKKKKGPSAVSEPMLAGKSSEENSVMDVRQREGPLGRNLDIRE
ncbi:hypothetical protein QBC39DRAFT_288437 [Podospora conica]|nr:hypothetical protein QBC39DRAFT_288437 [Schizothecium conicum]